MISQGKEKKRKATALPSDAPQKLHKKPKNSIENAKGSVTAVPAAEPATINGSETAVKSKPKPRKRAADFLSDTDESAAKEPSAIPPERERAENADEPKKKETKEGAGSSKAALDATDTLLLVKKPPKVEKPKQKKKSALLSSEPVTSSSVALATSDMVADQIDKPVAMRSEAPAKKPKKTKKSKGQASENAGTLTAGGVSGVAEKADHETPDPLTNKDVISMSMQVEGQVTAEKELEDEWGSEDEEDDQGAALLAGFDSDGEDNTEDVGFEVGQALPKLSKKTSKKVKKAVQEGTKEGPGTVYVGRIPHGFYEDQMREYFSQFGTITKLRLSRNRITGASKHFAFIEFESDDVAKIVANTMDNYLMFGHILKCKHAPQDSLHPALWKGANKHFRKVPYIMLQKRALEAPKTAEQWEAKNAKEQKKREQKAEKMKDFGYEMKLPQLKNPQEVLEQRKLQNAEQQKLLRAAEEVQDGPVGAIEPPQGLPKDEVAMEAEKTKKTTTTTTKKNKPIQQQQKEPIAEVDVPQQPTESTAGKRDKRKEKKAKSKDAKAQQTQLDAQLIGDTRAATEETYAAAEPLTSETVQPESSPDKINKGDPATANVATNGNDKKRKRRKTKDSKAGSAETIKAEATHAAKADLSAEKPKKKKRKSENGGEPKSILKKPGKA